MRAGFIFGSLYRFDRLQGLEAQSIYYFHRNGRPRPPCKPLKDKPPGLIRAAVENHLPLDLFEI
ncbi:TPA: hypothetical protein ACJYO2_001998 [Neisseria gonorrhoeae]